VNLNSHDAALPLAVLPTGVPRPVTKRDARRLRQGQTAPFTLARAARPLAADKLKTQRLFLSRGMAKNVGADFAPHALVIADDLFALEDRTMEQTECFAVSGADDIECLIAIATVT